MNRPTTLKLTWPGGERAIPHGTTVRIGRDQNCDVVIDNSNVSRRHAEIRSGPDGWELIDIGSTQGTHVHGSRIEAYTINGRVDAVLGRVGPGVTISLETEKHLSAGSIDDMQTEAVSERARPGGQLREEALGGATVVTGDRLVVECGGRNYQFEPGSDRTIGRDESADVVSSNPTVSRRHAVIRYDGASWQLEDLGSSGGTWVDGRRVRNVELKGSTAIWLGDPESGERVVLVTSGTRRLSPVDRAARFVRTGRGQLVLLGAVVLAVVLSAVAFLSGGGSGSPSPDRLARASVALIVPDLGSGSGTIIDAERGLILTNAHVAAPSAPGTGVRDGLTERSLDEGAGEVLIAITPSLDRAAEVRYRGEVVAADGILDLAVVKITKLGSGSILESGDLNGLVDVALGDSDDLDTGDRVRVIGFPGVSDSNAPTLTQGVVAGSVQDDRVGSNRAFLNIDADINPGNSGGGAFDDRGKLVGIPTLLSVQYDTLSKSNRMRPINLAKPLIDAARAGEAYTSPFFTELTGSESIVSIASVAPSANGGFSSTCAGGAFDVRPGDPLVSVAITYDGFAAARHQDLLARVVHVSTGGSPTLLGMIESQTQHPFGISESGCVTATIPLFDADGNRTELVAGDYALQVFAGPNYRLLDEVAFTAPGVVGAQ